MLQADTTVRQLDAAVVGFGLNNATRLFEGTGMPDRGRRDALWPGPARVISAAGVATE